MKKLIILLVLVAFTLSVSAQRASSTTALGTASLKTLTLLPVDTITQHSTAYWNFDVNRSKLYYFALSVKLDTMNKTANNNHVYVDVYGSMNGTNWIATSATRVKFGGSVDSTFYLGDVATGVLWRYLRVNLATQTKHVRGVRVSEISLKVADK